MIRRASIFEAAVTAVVVWSMALSGCAPKKPVILDESTITETSTAEPVVETVESLPAAEKAVPDATLEEGLSTDAPLGIREVKLISDNGQEALFVKLTHAPRARGIAHYTQAKPNRLIIELEDDQNGEPLSENLEVDNPVVSSIGLSRDRGRLRISVKFRTSEVPSYTVETLNDVLVAFIGERNPTGKEPIAQNLVYRPGSARPRVKQVPPPAPAVEPPSQLAAAPPPVEAGPPASVAPVVPVAPPSPALAAPAPPPTPVSPPPPPAVVEPVPPPLPVEDAFRVEKERKTYVGQPISLDLKDADIRNVLRLMAEVSQLNIVATDDVKGNITLRLFDVPWDQAFDIILDVMGLVKLEQGNVVRISTAKRVHQEQEELRKLKQQQVQVEQVRTEYIRVNYAKAAKLASLLATRGRGRGAGGGGGAGGAGAGGRGGAEGFLSPRGTVLVDEFTNTLIVRDIPSQIAEIHEFVRRLDVQIPQVLIESNIVEATTDFARDLGIQWGYRTSIGPQTGTSTGSNFPGSIGLSGGGVGTGGSGLPLIADFPAGGNFGPGAGSALNLMLGSLNGTQALDMRLSALEERGKGRVISRPRVVTLNNVAAEIKSLTIIRVRMPQTGTTIATGAGAEAAGAQAATEEIETGIILSVTPQVSSDGYVLLQMDAKSSQADFSRTVDNIPTEISRQATSNVLVRDGQTVVIGGIYRDTSNQTSSGVPFFSAIPGINWLFRNDSISDRREDLLVFLTPRVIRGTEHMHALPTHEQVWENRRRETPG